MVADTFIRLTGYRENMVSVQADITSGYIGYR